MSRPTPGQNYTVTTAERNGGLSRIAAMAYGDQSLRMRIYNANKSVIGDDPNLIYPGQVLFIPGDDRLVDAAVVEEVPAQSLNTSSVVAGKKPGDFTILINGEDVPVVSGRAKMTVDTVDVGWSFVIPFNPQNSFNYLPDQYQKCQCFIGKYLIGTGMIYDFKGRDSENGRVNSYVAYSKTADIVDSTMEPPYEYNNVSLRDLAGTIIEPRGIEVVFDNVESDEKFDRATADEGDSIFEFFKKLCQQRGVVMSPTPRGELRFYRANLDQQPVAELRSGDSNIGAIETSFSSRKRFKTITARGQSPRNKQKRQTVTDPDVPASRTLFFKADNTTNGNLADAAKYRYNRTFAEAYSLKLPVSGWYSPGGELWQADKTVTVLSEVNGILSPYTFYIRGVEYEFARPRKAILDLVPPGVYTLGDIKKPWKD